MRDSRFDVPLPLIPERDLSGAVGKRLLRLMTQRGSRALQWLAGVRADDPSGRGEFIVPDTRARDGDWALHVLYHASTSAQLLAVLARFGGEADLPAVASRQELIAAGAALIRGSIATHPESGSGLHYPGFWEKLDALRMVHLVGLPTWLLWEWLDEPTRLRFVRLLEFEADRWLDTPAPAQLFDDTQAETNAWLGGGLAVACTMLRSHPHRDPWLEKAKELMISAYATSEDVTSERVIDGKPLRAWLTGANAFPDGSVENHGFVHPDYIATMCEMVRSAIFFHLAGEPVPEAATFNADRVLAMLMKLNLPDGNHFYVQGSDYGSRRFDSFFQACNVLPLRPDPLLEACFLRSLSQTETMIARRPELNPSGWLNLPYDFGTVWALCENYLMRRFFGDGGPAIPEDQIESRLAGVHHSPYGRFILHRTATTLSSFSWHAACPATNLSAMTMPLDRDILCSPLPARGYFGCVCQQGREPAPPVLVWAQVQPRTDSFGAMVGLEWCGGAVRQHSAMISLPDGASVYLEERTATRAVELSLAQSGNVAIYDDLRWPWQSEARVFVDGKGSFAPGDGGCRTSHWINVDQRLGYVALGTDRWSLGPGSEQWKTWLLSWDALDGGVRGKAGRVVAEAGTTLSRIAIVILPNATAAQTAAAADGLQARGWTHLANGAMAVTVGRSVVYAVFGPVHQRFKFAGRWIELAPQSAGYVNVED